MTGYPPATIARRLACGVCPLCDDPGKPVAARSGITHEHAGLLCLEHLLDALGMPLERPRPAFEPPDPSAVRAAFRATLRVPSEANAAPTAVTAARQMPPPPLEPEALAAAMLTMRELGGVPLRSEPTYGEPPDPVWVEPLPSGPCPALPDETPAAARRMAQDAALTGWRVRGRVSPSSCSLYAARGFLRLDVHWAGGRFRTAWVSAGDGCVKVGARQAAAILKTGG